MKKRVAVILACVLAAFTLTACGLGKCDFCGETGKVSKEDFFGRTVSICDDCR